MDRSNLLRWLLMGVAIFLFIQYGLPTITGDTKGSDVQPFAGIVDDVAPPADSRAEAKTCDIKGPRFKAQLTTKGGALAHFWLTDAKYTNNVDGKPIDLVTTTLESVMPLRTDLRSPSGDADQLAFNDVDYDLASSNGKSCTFVHESDGVKVEKVVSATDRDFELKLGLTVTNTSDAAKKHRLTVQQTDWRTSEDIEGSMGRVSELMTKAEVLSDDDVTRLDQSDFEPDEFENENVTNEKWRRPGPAATWAAVSSSYFTKMVFPIAGPTTPAGESQVEHLWDHGQFKNKDRDPNLSYIYRARLNYGLVSLEAGASQTYELLSFAGPKERHALGGVGGGELAATDVLDLGVFGAIGKLLISYLYLLYGFVGTWGIAICVMTITVKMLLFPLSIAQIKSSMAMRQLKPQMDEINTKYKEDATQRGLAMQELWRKNNVTNPMLGCLPVMLQMPVWFALYTALQTAVELYHTPFAWFADLSASDPYFVLPVLLGASSFLQQHLMPMQGDAMQQKMMKFLMPGMFTVFMLFLPAGLGIYFLTNTWLGIVQQLAVERFYKSQKATESATASSSEDEDDATEQPEGDNKKKKAGGPKRAKARA
jgi:YidC/Oxa1 family membrane protein insertase